MRLLVCGGRDFTDTALLVRVLDNLHMQAPVSELIHGGARGADQMAGTWAAARDIPTRVFLANWAALGKAAGAVRNRLMLEQGQPDLVVAFKGGNGTRDMVRRATEAGVEVRKPR